MAKCVVRVDLDHKEIQDAIVDKAKKLAGVESGSSTTTINVDDDKQVRAFVEFQHTGKARP